MLKKHSCMINKSYNSLCTICVFRITQALWGAMKTNKRRWQDSPLMFNHTLQFHTLLNVGKTWTLPESTAEKKRLVYPWHQVMGVLSIIGICFQLPAKFHLLTLAAESSD